jgi:PTS system nitrogen regulatory IIA component
MAEATTAVGAFLRLREPIQFDSPDNKPVDLVFAMVVPEHFHDEHLVLLAQLAEMFDDVSQRQELRVVESVDQVLQLIESWQK